MNVKNCRSCGRIFNYISGLPICPQCREKTEAQYLIARDYVRDNKGCSIKQLSKECEIDENLIRQWVREERLVFDTESGIGVSCEKCGVAIPSGRLCNKCKLELMNGLQAAGRQPQAPKAQERQTRENPRMRFLDNR